MQSVQERFEISSRGSSVGRELLGGLTTFLAMSYIIFVQVGVLKMTGMDSGGIIIATCLSAGVASIIMGLWANYPIALAAGMGENFFFAFTLCGVGAAAGAFRLTWQEALALVAISGTLFLFLSFVGLRSYVLNSIPGSLKSGIAAGIGLMIAAIGLWYGNIIDFNAAAGPTLVSMKGNTVAWLSLSGILLVMVLTELKVMGAILITIVVEAIAAMCLGLIDLPGNIVAMPSGFSKTAGGFVQGFEGLFELLQTSHAMDVILLCLILLMMDMFDTIGTLVCVADRCGLIKEGKLPNANRALAADATGTIVGAAFGSSTVTAYVESATGVAVGARTGLAAITAGVLMIAAIFFHPIIAIIGGGVEIAPHVSKHPLIAPALVMVGAMMLRAVKDIDWEDVTEYLPAFVTLLVMPLTLSISTGIAAGFITCAAGKLLTGKARQCPPVVYVVAVLFLIRYIVGVFIAYE